MGKWLTLSFAIICFFGAILLSLSLIHFSCAVNRRKKGRSVDPLVKKCAFISLFGYTTFVILSFALYLIQSLYYIPSIHINYSTIICQAQTFNIVFFMTGKLAMYFYFMALVHVAFRGSFLAYPVKIIGSMAIMFFLLMCTIGAFYMFFLYKDFSSVGPITSPADCDKFEASQYSKITIFAGSSCDAIWSFTCLLLFYLRLRKITKLMTKQHRLERKETDAMMRKIKSSNKKKINVQHKTTTNRTDAIEIAPKVAIEKLELMYVPSISSVNSLDSPPAHAQLAPSGSNISSTKVLAVVKEEKTQNIACSPSSSAPSTPTTTKHTIDTKQDTMDGSTLSGGTHILMDMQHSHSASASSGGSASEMDPDYESITFMTDVDIESTAQSVGTQTSEYTLMRNKYQSAPCIVPYNDGNSQSSSNKIFTSLKLKFDNTSSKIKRKIKRRNSWQLQRKQKAEKKKPDIVHKFLPIMLKLSILSAWCAFSTFGLGFGLWTIYPTLSSVIDSTINALCVYLSFGFAKPLYEVLCLPFISCRNCENYRIVVIEANKMEKDKNFETEQNVLG